MIYLETINKQTLLKRELSRRILLSHFKGEERFPSIATLTKEFGVGTGTIQGGLQDLKNDESLTFKTFGSNGTFVYVNDIKKLCDNCEFKSFIGILPLDNNLLNKGIATGLYAAFSEVEMPIHMLFARGSYNRLKLLNFDKCDFIIMSEAGYKQAIIQNRNLRKISNIGTSFNNYCLITPKDYKLELNNATIAYDYYSFEQQFIIDKLNKKQKSNGNYLSVHLKEMVISKELEVALINDVDSVKEDNLNYYYLKDMNFNFEDLEKCVFAVNDSVSDNYVEILDFILNKTSIKNIQNQVITNEIHCRY